VCRGGNRGDRKEDGRRANQCGALTHAGDWDWGADTCNLLQSAVRHHLEVAWACASLSANAHKHAFTSMCLSSKHMCV
jgi:hypothetical protein